MRSNNKIFKTILFSVFVIVFILNAVIFSSLVFGFKIPYFEKAVITKTQYQEYKQMKKVLELKKKIEELYYKETDDDSLTEGAIRGMFNSLNDNYSYYISKEELKTKQNSEKGILIGIGIGIEILEDGKIKIISVDETGTAHKAGIIPGDIIVKIDDIKLNRDNIFEAINIIGKDNKEFIIFGDYPNIKIVIKREEKTISLDVERKKMIDRALSYEVIGETGYIKIDRFIKDTPAYFKEALEYLNKEKVEKLILDLRDNPGGLLDSLVEATGYLTGKEAIIYIKNRTDKETTYISKNEKIFEGEVCILVNENSASASEAMTLALREQIGAKVVGVKTFGKGIVQTTYNLADGTGYKLTTSEYFSPNGTSIHKKGVIPDYEVKDYKMQTEKAKELLKGEK